MHGSSYWSRRRQGVSRRRVIGGWMALAAGAGAVAIVGCGDDKEPAASGGSPSAGAATAAATPGKGGALNLAALNPPLNLDPHLDQSWAHIGYTGPCYGRLVKFKTGRDIYRQSITVPDHAEKWEQVDPQTYIFTLRPNLKFHNVAPTNGRAVTAQDVIYSFERQRALKVNAAFLSDIQEWQAPDARTVRFTLHRPFADFLKNLSETFNKIISREVVEKYGDLKQNRDAVVGSGPFMLESWGDQQVSIKRYPDYYDPNLPYLDKVTYTAISDRTTQIAAFTTKKLDVLSVNSVELAQVQAQLKEFNSRREAVANPYGYMATMKEGPTKDLRVRQAISAAINRKQLIDTVWRGDGELTTSVNVDRDVEAPQEELARIFAYDVNKAKQLLQEAGVSNWNPKMTIWEAADAVASGELVVSMLRAAGITPAPEVKKTTETPLIMMGQGLVSHWGAWPNFSSPTSDLSQRWRTGGSWNGPGLNDPELDDLIDRQAVELDANKRNDMLRQIQRRLLANLSYIPAARPIVNVLAQAEVQDYNWNTYLNTDSLMLAWRKGG